MIHVSILCEHDRARDGQTAMVTLEKLDGSGVSLGVHASHGPGGDHYRRALMDADEARRLAIEIFVMLGVVEWRDPRLPACRCGALDERRNEICPVHGR